jgi:hypothetical protein
VAIILFFVIGDARARNVDDPKTHARARGIMGTEGRDGDAISQAAAAGSSVEWIEQ